MERPVAKSGPLKLGRASEGSEGLIRCGPKCLSTHTEAGKGEVQGPSAGASWQNPQKPQRWGFRCTHLGIIKTQIPILLPTS